MIVDQTPTVAIGNFDILALRNITHATDLIISESGEVAPLFAVAINPEKIMLARKDASVRNTLQSADFRFADGIGVILAMRIKSKSSIERVPGCDLWEKIQARAALHKIPVYLIGGRKDVIEKTAAQLVSQYQSNIVGQRDGYFSAEEEDALIESIRSSGAKVVTVAMGSPRQELFIGRCRERIPSAFYMGVGGTYDVFVGNVRRAPPLWRRLNLEWFYRLLRQPKRVFRQFALIQFALLAITNRL